MRSAAIVLMMGVACAPVPPTSIHDVAFPDGFVMDTARQVTLEVRGVPGTAHLAVGTLAGEALFDGPARFVVDHPLDVRVPGTDDALVAAVDGRPVDVPIDDAGHAVVVLP